jgi:hypothetical protein
VPSPVRLSRRGALRLAGNTIGGLAVAGLLGGCTGRGSPEPPDAVADALAALWDGEQALVARYEQVLGTFPALATRLEGVRDDHRAHADAVRALLDSRRPPTATPAAPSASPSLGAVPATRTAALANLASAETAAASAAVAVCLLAEGDTAALLASVAACESSHLVVLR